MSLPLPDWLEKLPEDQRFHARKKFLLRLAALYAVPEGGVRNLAKAMGLSHNTLHTAAAANAPLSINITKAIEQMVGRDKLPRELLNPEVYQIGE